MRGVSICCGACDSGVVSSADAVQELSVMRRMIGVGGVYECMGCCGVGVMRECVGGLGQGLGWWVVLCMCVL